MYNNQIDFENDTRFSILNVAYSVGLNNLKREGVRYTTECPFCGAKPGHFYLTPEDPRDNYKNVYKCVSCGKSGSSTRLYYELTSCASMGDAVKEIAGIEVKSKVKKIIKKDIEAISENKKHLNELADINKRNKVYRLLIKSLKLSDIHYKNLKNRGLSKDQIIKNGYRTLPKEHSIKIRICRDILKLGLSLKGVPGFYTTYNGNWTFWTPKEGGFLVPVQDYLGRIQGCQIRKNTLKISENQDENKKKKNKKKYPWFSSGQMTNGTYAAGFIHVHWNSTHSAKKAVITEGPLKGTIASIFSDTTFVAVPGTNSFNGIIDVLKAIGAEKIYIAYDMDKYKNVYVMKALFKLKQYLNSNSFNDVKISDWNRTYKGIDDYLYHIRLEKLQTV